jgi:hypothetical protein
VTRISELGTLMMEVMCSSETFPTRATWPDKTAFFNKFMHLEGSLKDIETMYILLTATQSLWDFSLSQEWAITLTPRFLNSWSWTAMRPNSVVQTGVKSAGCENSKHHLKTASNTAIQFTSLIHEIMIGISITNM